MYTALEGLLTGNINLVKLPHGNRRLSLAALADGLVVWGGGKTPRPVPCPALHITMEFLATLNRANGPAVFCRHATE